MEDLNPTFNEGKTPSANDVLERIKNAVPSLDVRSYCNLKSDEKPKSHHYYISIGETINRTAAENNAAIKQDGGNIYVYNDKFYETIEKREFRFFLSDCAERMGVDHFLAKKKKFREELAEQYSELCDFPQKQDPKDILINFSNCTGLFTPNGLKLKPHSPDDHLTYVLPFEYNPNAKADLFFQYLDRVLPDKEKQRILAEYIGYVFLRNDCLKLEKVLLLFGSGANGKSVFLEIIIALLGLENTSNISAQILTDPERGGPYRAIIANKLVNIATEISTKLNPAYFKALASGEPVDAKPLYCSPYTITNYARLIFSCNELPKSTEQTNAFFRRFLIIPFDQTIPDNEQDKELDKKIKKTELSGVFNWVLEGLDRLLRQRGFSECTAAKQANDKFKLESDSVKLFIDEEGYTKSLDYLLIKDIYTEYHAFCIGSGHRPVNKTNFMERLSGAGYVVAKKNFGFHVYINKQSQPF